MKELCRRVVETPAFERFIVFLIVAVILGLETSPDVMARYGGWLHFGSNVILGAFVVEAALRITAVAPRLRLYFGNAGTCSIFSVVVLSFMPASGEFAMVARLVRLLRVLRLVSTVPKLRLIVQTLVHSIPSMGHVLLMMLLFYIYGIAGYQLFHAIDPDHWGTVGRSLLTLFQLITLEAWVELMQTAMQAHPLAWIFFLSFVLIGTFVVMNLFIAIVINNLEESKVEETGCVARTRRQGGVAFRAAGGTANAAAPRGTARSARKAGGGGGIALRSAIRRSAHA